MQDFTYRNPTRIVFGKGTIARLKELVRPQERVLLTYGGGSIRKNGVYDQVQRALSGRDWLEFGGIQPNPLYETLLAAVQLVKQEQVTFLLAVGGGSVVDATKFIAAAAAFQGLEPWDILAKGAPVRAALPLGTVLTLPATGSESNGFAVISRQTTREKLAFGSDLCFPQFAILDPTVTMTLPPAQVRNGIVDAFMHVLEQYATYPVNAALQDRQAEAILKTLIQEGPKSLADPQDYDARANLLWCATQALNGWIGQGVPQDWSTHMIGHELTACFGVAHAESLAIVMPSLFRHQMARKLAKLAQLARRVWDVQEPDDRPAAEAGLAKTEEFFHSLGMKTKLADYGISAPDAATKVATRFRARGLHLGEHQAIDAAAAAQILMAC
ncbi:MAG: iron-containing alcohol dehydrogenase [Verrucomicrobiota bacterium]|jgi:NADP-dependent alcohol dehydrogenase